jgi:hypothetical protein
MIIQILFQFPRLGNLIQRETGSASAALLRGFSRGHWLRGWSAGIEQLLI